MARILHDNLRKDSLWPHFLLRGDPVTYNKQRFSIIFTWRGLKHVVPLKEWQAPKEDPAAYLKTILAALIRRGGLDQPPKRHIRFLPHKREEQATRTIRFTKNEEVSAYEN